MALEQPMRDQERELPFTPFCTVLRSFGPNDPRAEDVRTFFQAVAAEQCWQPGGDLDATSPYVPFSRYFALAVVGENGEGVERSGTICGGLYLVQGNPSDNLPTRSVWPELDFGGRTEVADVFLLALSSAVRGQGVPYSHAGDGDGETRPEILPLFWQLCVGMWQWCQQEDIHELCGIATPRSAALYRRLGWPLSIVGPERSHWGEPCVPFLLSVSAVYAEIARRAARGSALYRHVLAASRHRAEESSKGAEKADGTASVPVSPTLCS